MTGLWALVAVLVAVGATGLLLRAREGRIRTSAAPVATGPALPGPVRAALHPDDPVTLVQLSTTFCTPCRQTRVLLADLAGRTEGLHHVDLDVTSMPEVARELGVLRTPTTLALSSSGAEILRVGGVPRREALLAALAGHLPATNG
ncbi:TlpA family protein disulfide reductase [Umezawaea tangerina]|uniref:Thiol-disulfide isomerase/thioredoxin n=1 Tax=Umezawaea tangerina TaxID=84725 RepID=A0A2T0TC81_9PSEU|nr:thioredoxin family protein [Umezawaea tangerina]PRY43270.1 thiol-disulfide isomerase/thioredoxin [Umezawaea tangerina]